MSNNPSRARTLLLVLVLGLVLLVTLSLRAPEPASQESRPEPALADGSRQPGAQGAATVRAGASPLPGLSVLETPPETTFVASVDTAPSLPSRFRESDYEQGRMQIYRDFIDSVRLWTPEEYRRNKRDRDQLSGVEAYRVYVYLRTCLDAPRSMQALSQSLDHLSQAHEGQSQQPDAPQLEEMIEERETQLARCEAIEPGVDPLETVLIDWLTLAAERGYGQAQLAYHQSVRWLLGRQWDLVMREPERVGRYRSQASRFLRAALESGHQEALAEYALALHEGVLFDRDAEAAYGYAGAAESASHGTNQTAQRLLAMLEAELSASQQRRAGELSRDLCERYCR